MSFDSLSDTAWRVLTGGLMWCAENGTDGDIPSRYVKYLHPDGEKPDANLELVKAEIWIHSTTGYLFIDWNGALGQSTAAEVAAYRQNARERSRRYRDSQRKKLEDKTTKALPQGLKPEDVMRDATSDVTRDVRAHVGEGIGEGEAVDSEAGLAWETKPIPASASGSPGSVSDWVQTGDGEWSEASSSESVAS